MPVIDKFGETKTVTTYVFSLEAIRRRQFHVLEEEMRRRRMIRKASRRQQLHPVGARSRLDRMCSRHESREVGTSMISMTLRSSEEFESMIDMMRYYEHG